MSNVSPRADAFLKLALVIANLVALNFLVAPVRARLDLTEQREYTISDATRRVLRELPDQVEVYGYFSSETHPKLKPLVPMIGDVLEEFRIRSEGKVVARMVDPKDDPIAEKEAYRRFNVRATPFQIESQYERGVKSAYFSLVVAFGEHYVKLDSGDLIEVQQGPNETILVKLKSIEYQLTSAIDRVVREFATLDMKLAERTDPVKVEIFVSDPSRVPEGEVRDYVAKKRKGLEELAGELGKKYPKGLTVRIADPEGEPGLAEKVRQEYQMQPLRAQQASRIWLDAVVIAGKKGERIPVRDLPDRERAPSEVREAIEAAMRRLLPGAMKTIGIASNKPKLTPDQMMAYAQQGMEPPGDEYGQLRTTLKQGYRVIDVDLSSGSAPLDVDVLLVMKPKEWTQKHELALDQFLMLGGKAVVCVDQCELPQTARSLSLSPLKAGGADDLLARYGVTVGRSIILDEQNVPYPLPRWRDLGGLRMQVVEQVPYPWFLDVRGDSIDVSNPAVTGVESCELLWASPVSYDESKQKGAHYAKLLTTSEKAWTSTAFNEVEPKESLEAYGKGAKQERFTLAVAIDGKLRSAFADRPDAVTGSAGVEPIFESPEGTRLVVIGDTDFASDIAARISPAWKGNVQLVQNLVDWCLADLDLIKIRARGAADRPLKSLDVETKTLVRNVNFAVPIGLVIVVGLVRGALRRFGSRRTRPPSRSEGGAGSAQGAARKVEEVRS